MGLYVSPTHLQLKFAQFTSEKHVSLYDLAAASLKLGLQNQSNFFSFFFFSRNCILTNSSLLFVTFTFKIVNNDADAVLGPGFLFIQYNSQAIIQSTLWKITIYSYKLIRYSLDCSY